MAVIGLTPNAVGPQAIKGYARIWALPLVAHETCVHQQEWIAACKGGPVPLSNLDHSGPSIELALLGNIASLVGEPLEFDPVRCNITNNDEADRALRPIHRKGWAL